VTAPPAPPAPDATDTPRAPRALLSVYDKAGIVDLARSLHDLGWDLVSSGGTARAIAEDHLPVTDVAELTGVPAILGHRVVTLHPKVHGGLLADPTDAEHAADMERYGIEPIDLVVGNIYPFSSDPSVELIDIGGPTMIRAAAKNHARVGVVVDPADYPAVLDELRADGALTESTRRRLARKAFAHTSAYDAAIVAWLDDQGADPAGPDGADDGLPRTLHLGLERVQDLRYGENPHQTGARYRRIGSTSWWDDVTQHGGMALSYLNIFDADAAWALVHDLAGATGRAAVAIIKHANPCGVAVADDLATAYQRAFECDERSAFGGIVATSEPVDAATVERIEAAAQADVIIAPGYDDGVVERLAAKRKNTRVLSAPLPTHDALQLRQIDGGFLVQDNHHFVAGRDQWQVVTERHPTDAEWADTEFAWRVCGWVTSNSIVLAKDGTAWGIGAGQQNRVESGEIAAAKAAGRAQGGACASDAFYPFPDGIEAAAAAGVAVVIQPGGAMRDDANIARADELGLAMVFTGERHFRH
jgi:phosphoribosylaminoimidazolecarboxamide formyltransferase / IMP cyclohydrolase